MSSALSGLKVIDFSRLLPGPYCSWLLADMGAEVIRIENPREIDKQTKVFGWDRLDDSARLALRETDILARNKRSVMLDIGDPEAQIAIRALIANADIVIEDYRPGVLAGLGLGYDDLKKDNPGLIYTSLTLCGQTGPYRDKPGHDPVALSIAGVQSRIGEDPDEPSFSGVPAADVITGTHAAFATLAAVQQRHATGLGQHVGEGLELALQRFQALDVGDGETDGLGGACRAGECQGGRDGGGPQDFGQREILQDHGASPFQRLPQAGRWVGQSRPSVPSWKARAMTPE